MKTVIGLPEAAALVAVVGHRPAVDLPGVADPDALVTGRARVRVRRRGSGP